MYDRLLRRVYRATYTVVDDYVKTYSRLLRHDVTMTKWGCHRIPEKCPRTRPVSPYDRRTLYAVRLPECVFSVLPWHSTLYNCTASLLHQAQCVPSECVWYSNVCTPVLEYYPCVNLTKKLAKRCPVLDKKKLDQATGFRRQRDTIHATAIESTDRASRDSFNTIGTHVIRTDFACRCIAFQNHWSTT